MKTRLIPSFSIFFLFSLTFILYLPGISGGLFYDDIRPLSTLNDILSLDDALHYVFTEISGPLGRPISMMTFLLNVGDYEVNNSHFFLINITIHAMNVVLVYFIVRLLGNLLAINNIKTISLVTALFWLVIPLNISTSLIAIQRMAGLSALFVLAGVATYLASKKI